jgi:hypothetical protein
MFNKSAIILILSLLLAAWNVMADEPDWTNYQSVLNHLKPGIKNQVSLTLVDYLAIKTSHSLEKAYQDVSSFKLDRLSDRNEKQAFYINAYNILAMKMVADHWPMESIKDAGGLFSPVWNKSAGMLGGEIVTLGEIEHKILRPMAEPRIHFAIVCASVSCPDLRNEPFTASRLNMQLDDQTRQFLKNQNKGLRIGIHAIRVSKIFSWFDDDFEASGGVSAFIKHYRSDLPALKTQANLPYDWAVNAIE